MCHRMHQTVNSNSTQQADTSSPGILPFDRNQPLEQHWRVKMIYGRQCRRFLSREQLHRQHHKWDKAKLIPYPLWSNLASCRLTNSFDTLLVFVCVCALRLDQLTRWHMNLSNLHMLYLLHESFVSRGTSSNAIHVQTACKLIIYSFNLYSNCICSTYCDATLIVNFHGYISMVSPSNM